MKTALVRFLTVLLIPGPLCLAATIEWGVQFSSGTYSDGSAIGDGFVFRLGTFGSGFTPSRSNVAEWEGNFISGGIEGETVLWNNPGQPLFPSFGEGAATSVFRSGGAVQEGDQVFLWGYNSMAFDRNSEWLLLTNGGWFFPEGTASGIVPERTVRFLAHDVGTEMIFGTAFNLAGNEEIFDRAWRTEAVPEPGAYAVLFGLMAGGLVLFRRLKG